MMKRRGGQAWLLPLSLVLLAGLINASATTSPTTTEVERTTPTAVKTTVKPEITVSPQPVTSQPEVAVKAASTDKLSFDAANHEDKLSVLTKPVINPKEMLLQEINTLNDEAESDKKLQNELAKALNVAAQKVRAEPRPSTTPTPPTPKPTTMAEGKAMQELVEAETDVAYDDDEDDLDDDDDDDDEYDDDDDDIEDEEEIMTQCPDYCRCAGQYAAATTARCSKLVDKQVFGPGIAHLRIENAGEIQLGPHALRARGLQQLESITIVDTRISLMDRTAFDGIPYLFAVNLSRNGIIDIHPDTFQNNTQLSLLTISGHPFWRNWTVTKDYFLDAQSVTELDFSWNSMPDLPPSAFQKMPNLVYLNLKQNRLGKVEKEIFDPMDSLLELDLSGNMLDDLPRDIFKDKGLQTLRISDNAFTSLAKINASKLTSLHASSNKIQAIGKDDLAGVPSLDKLVVSFNSMKRIHPHAFAHLDQLNYLDISDNKLTSINEHHLKNNHRLQILLMSDNPGLRALPVFKMNGLEYDTYSVYRLEAANCGLEYLKPGTFDTMPALTSLNLARNKLTGLPKGLLEGLSSLRELDLSLNLISVVPAGMLRGATTLGKLNLAGNPLVTLQVTPFLQAPGLSRLDVSKCQLRRIWSEARQPLKSIRFLSVRGNQLERITVEELKAMPKLSGLDASMNPMVCDNEFNDAIQWLISHGVTPMETLKYISNIKNDEEYAETEGVTEWSDLAKTVCSDEFDGPPSRLPKKPAVLVPIDNRLPDYTDDEENSELSKEDLEADIAKLNALDHGQKVDERIDEAYNDLDKAEKYYGEWYESGESHAWYDGVFWPVLIFGFVTLAILLIVIQFARFLAKGRGRGPVIRPPLLLRQGLVDNKNCGLVYKPLQEEIPTPHMPKRGSFYSSSTFHYDKIVPESV
ncbi:receptor-like protein kinase 5 [Diachasma alloeum]|uniref:receptor-like protein kinase 5 n=1 Tax=Diachasma alloeum TaxID=454923 RepID=UPI000738271E|nr:receptor-like protein kinase 5 [Diachasma alloeum]XP_015111701.1 receptor-like protein kinase 5 [Diachasma alloeum]